MRRRKKIRKEYVYSPYKAVFWMDKIEQLRRGELIIPLYVQWDLTNVCNLDCTYCFYHTYNLDNFNRTDTFDSRLALKVIKELKNLGVKAIEFTGGGEPSLHPNFKLIIHYAYTLGLKLALVTNGTNLDEFAIRTLRNFEWVRFSVDAATPETYEKVKRRPKELFNTVIRNINKLMDVKSNRTIVGMSFIVAKENYHEVYEAAKLAKSLGLDNIRFSLAMTPEGAKYYEGIWDECVEQLKKAKELEDDNFKVFTFSDRIEDIAEKRKSRYCGYHHFVGVIGADSCVYPCCRLKYLKDYCFGSLYEKSFKEIWFGEKRIKFIESIKHGCPYSCWMYEKNKFIEYLLQKNPPHLEFI